jgi:hypothetical protein
MTSISATSRYSDGERDAVHALGVFFLELADVARAEIIFRGLVEIDPGFAPGRLGLAYVKAVAGKWDEVEAQSRFVLDREPRNPGALLFGVISAMHLGERTSAGSRLGEFGELIDAGAELDSEQLLVYRSQLIRYQGSGA